MADLSKASRTALMAAIHRFLAFKDQELKGPDDMARIFLPGKVNFFLSFKFIRKSVKNKMQRLVPGTYDYVTARTSFFDEQFKLALAENYDQIVLLGAGYDSRAIRFKADFQDTAVIELDEKSIQNEKLRLLRKEGIQIPGKLKFAPINFNKDNLQQVLSRVGYASSKRTLFLWEGVSMYLEEDAVAAMMQFVAAKSSKGSRIAFDYFDRAILDGDNGSYGAKEISAEVKKSGEPFRFGIDPQKIEAFLENHGLRLVAHYSPQDLEEKFLMNANKQLSGHVYGFGYLVVAEVE